MLVSYTREFSHLASYLMYVDDYDISAGICFLPLTGLSRPLSELDSHFEANRLPEIFVLPTATWKKACKGNKRITFRRNLFPRAHYMTLYLALLTMWWEDCSFSSSSLISLVISDLALATASSWQLSMARYSLRSPSGGALPGWTKVPRTVMPASEYSLIRASASCESCK